MSIFQLHSQHRSSLSGTKHADVCIIGAGMAGLNLATLLHQENKHVIVLEAETIGHAQSVRSTAKITCLPGFFYHDLMERIGHENSLKVARMMRKALEQYAEIIFKRKIECDFKRLPYQLISHDSNKIKQESDALKSLGFVCTTQLNAHTLLGKGATLTLENQAQFNPAKWMESIAQELEIYENSRVVHIDDHSVFTNEGCVVAKQIVFCDHYPFLNFPGMHFMKMHQERSYVLALKKVPVQEIMIYRDDEPVESLRFVNDIALYSGFSHPTGKQENDELEQMKQKALERFPQAEIIQEWSSQDCMTLDSLPYIGHFSSQKPDWYLATGFNKWGMIYSMVSALILRDQLLQRQNFDAEPFDSLRTILNTPIEDIKQTATALSGWFQEFLTLPDTHIKDIPMDEGGIVDFDGMSVGVYKDIEGTCYIVSSRCPHMKCQFTWNKTEKTWDCPCHGSRYDRYGNRIEGPAESQTILLRKEKYSSV